MRLRDLIEELQRHDPLDDVKFELNTSVKERCPKCSQSIAYPRSKVEFDRADREQGVVVIKLT